MAGPMLFKLAVFPTSGCHEVATVSGSADMRLEQPGERHLRGEGKCRDVTAFSGQCSGVGQEVSERVQKSTFES
eukprot:3210655-Alexandrium_andersonii.AAC.1